MSPKTQFLLTLVLALCASPPASAHMVLTSPPPLRGAQNPNTKTADYDYVAPLSQSGANYPCKGHLTALGTSEGASVATWAAGSQQSFTIGGGASHAGGSCQASLSEDGGKTFRVVKSYQGGCPQTGKPYSFKVPLEAKSGLVIFAWTWFNCVGNREMYMNCAAVTITGGGSGMSNYPPIFKANIGNGCSTVEGKDVVFPNPGRDVENTSKIPGPPVGNCGGSGPTGGSGSGVEPGTGTGTGAGPGPSQGSGSSATVSAAPSVPTDAVSPTTSVYGPPGSSPDFRSKSNSGSGCGPGSPGSRCKSSTAAPSAPTGAVSPTTGVYGPPGSSPDFSSKPDSGSGCGPGSPGSRCKSSTAALLKQSSAMISTTTSLPDSGSYGPGSGSGSAPSYGSNPDQSPSPSLSGFTPVTRPTVRPTTRPTNRPDATDRTGNSPSIDRPTDGGPSLGRPTVSEPTASTLPYTLSTLTPSTTGLATPSKNTTTTALAAPSTPVKSSTLPLHSPTTSFTSTSNRKCKCECSGRTYTIGDL